MHINFIGRIAVKDNSNYTSKSVSKLFVLANNLQHFFRSQLLLQLIIRLLQTEVFFFQFDFLFANALHFFEQIGVHRFRFGEIALHVFELFLFILSAQLRRLVSSLAFFVRNFHLL
jgi:hypothetical protein